jgi:spore coat protein A, manganese oxidase
MPATRHRLIAVAAGAVGALVLATGTGTAATPLDPLTLTKYVDPLPLPGVATADEDTGVIDMTMSAFTQQLHAQLPATPLWGYNGSYPGPTIEARTGTPLTVNWINSLPEEHFLPIDRTLHGAMEGPDVRAVTHLHGGHVPPEVDGGPDDWFLPGEAEQYVYPNSQQAATLWYHDHAIGITRLNVYAGLAGYYLVRDGYEEGLGLPGGLSDPSGPSGPFEVPLVIQDRMFNDDGSLLYPDAGVTATHPVWVPEFFGDTILVNGKVWPYLNVEPRKYRFRILNGSNARVYTLRLAGGPQLVQIGAEGGLLSRSVALDQLVLAPGERADVVVDFSGYEGQTFLMRNNAKTPFPNGAPPSPATTGQIMQFRVGLMPSRPDLSVLPAEPRPLDRLDPADAAQTRDISLDEILDPAGNPLTALIEGKPWTDDTTIFPELGTTEVWRLVNTTGDTHPIHLHLVQFQILDRQKFDQKRYAETGQLRLLGRPKSSAPNEQGPKDTVQAHPGEVTRIIAYFDIAGKYPFHCHILEHEDNEMMRPFEVG